MDAKFFVNDAFIFGGTMCKAGMTLTISEGEVKAEIEKGNHPDNRKPLSGLLNHCSPADEYTAGLISEVKGTKEIPQEMTEEEIEKAADEIKAEMKLNGVAFNNGWKLKRFQMELKKARIEKGTLWKEK